MTAAFQTIAMLEPAGIDCHDVFLRNRHIGIVTKASTNAARAYFDMNATRGSTRKFPTAQAAIDYLIARREKLIAKRRAEKAAA